MPAGMPPTRGINPNKVATIPKIAAQINLLTPFCPVSSSAVLSQLSPIKNKISPIIAVSDAVQPLPMLLYVVSIFPMRMNVTDFIDLVFVI